MRFYIYENYDNAAQPVGRIEFAEPISVRRLASCALVPAVQWDNGEPDVMTFGLVQRTRVDTRPCSELGEE